MRRALSILQTMIALPTLIALALLWRNGTLPWLCWIVAALGVIAWLCGQAMLNAKCELQKGVTADRKVFDFWMLTSSILTWVHWLVCLTAVVLALTRGKR